MRAAWVSLGVLACVSKAPRVVAPADRGPEVRYRLGAPPDSDGQMLFDAVPGATWDRGLQVACQELLALATDRRAPIDPMVASEVTAKVGFPGQARFHRVLNGGAFPADLADEIVMASGGGPVDLALSRRTYGDGTALWIVGWAQHRADLDPMPRDLGLDDTVAVRVDLLEPGDARLFLASPDGPVEELSITDGVARWVDRFHSPGAWRGEVVVDRDGRGEVALIFTFYVDAPPPTHTGASARPPVPPNPLAAEAELYVALNALRREHGLAPVQRFELFEGVAREHSALMASSGQIGHALPGISRGVPTRAASLAHPRARHHENVAAAGSAAEAFALVKDSPGHLRNLLCEPCTHVAVGVALEPVLDRRPRLFVTWELLEFPQGPPRPIDHYNR